MTILFDLDGTLLDTSYDLHDAVNLLLQEEKLATIAYDEFRPKVGLGAKKILEYAFGLDPNSPAAQTYITKITPRLLDLYRETKYKRTVPFAGIEELLSKIEQSGSKWGIVTNRQHAFTIPILEAVGYSTRSACIVSGDTTPHSKPHPAPLLHACELLKVDPRTCLYVGDAETDVQAGKAAGMKTIAVSFGYSDPGSAISAWQADYIAHAVQDIFPWIRKWSSKEI